MADITQTPLRALIPTRANLVLASFFIAIHIGALLALPLFGVAPFWSVIAMSVLVLGTPAHWALVHDAIHGVLLSARKRNIQLGRVLAIFFGVPFRAVRFAHLRHHRYNRSRWGREEVYDPCSQSPVAAYCFHYLRISVGLYLGELALSLLCWLPPKALRPRLRALCPDLDDGTRGMSHLVDRELLDSSAISQIRGDGLFVIALYGTSFFLYGHHWPVLAGFLLGRAFLISQLDHAPHHATPLNAREHALNLVAPCWLQVGLLSFNLHRTHHENPTLPWSALSGASQFCPNDISLARAVLRQWKGPVAMIDAGKTADSSS